MIAESLVKNGAKGKPRSVSIHKGKVRKWLKSHYSVYITGRRTAVLEEAARKLNEMHKDDQQDQRVNLWAHLKLYACNPLETCSFQMDVSVKEDIAKFTEYIGQKEDSLDILVNNASCSPALT